MSQDGRVFLVAEEAKYTVDVAQFSPQTEQIQELYRSIETGGPYTVGVVVTSTLPTISSAITLANYLLRDRLERLTIVGLPASPTFQYADRWESSRFDEMLAQGTLVEVGMKAHEITDAVVERYVRVADSSETNTESSAGE